MDQLQVANIATIALAVAGFLFWLAVMIAFFGIASNVKQLLNEVRGLRRDLVALEEARARSGGVR